MQFWWAKMMQWVHGLPDLSRRMFTIVSVGVVIVIFLIVMLVKNHHSGVHDLPGILKSGRLYVLTDDSSMGFSVNNDKVGGFQYEIAKAFADSLGVELVITQENDFDKCRELILNGDYNLLANFTPVTVKLKSEFEFSRPLNVSRLVLIQRFAVDSTKKEHIAIRRPLDLANETVCVPEHSPILARIHHLAYEIAAPIRVKEMAGKSVEDLVKQVAEGKISYTVCDEDIAAPYLIRYPNLDGSVAIGFEQHQAWLVNKHSVQLLDKLNDFLTDFIGSAAYWRIYKKYF